MKKYLRFVVSIGLIALLIYMYRDEFQEALVVLLNANVFWIFVGMLAIAGNVFLSGWRLKYILRIFEISKNLVYLVKLYFVGNFYNNFLPTQMGGDFYKAYRLSRDTGQPGEATFTIFMDRFSGLVILYLVGLVGISLKFGLNGLILAIGLFCLALVGYFKGLKVLSNKISIVGKFKRANDVFMNNKKKAISVFATAMGVQFFAMLTTATAFYAVGVDVPLWSIFVFVPVVTIMGLIPSVDGWGVQEFGYVSLFSFAGVAEPQAIAASLLMRLMRILMSLIGGAITLTPGWSRKL